MWEYNSIMKNLNAFETEAVIDAGASLRLSGLPFTAGDRVRIFVVRENDAAEKSEIVTQLRGSILMDEDPFGPADQSARQPATPPLTEPPLDWRMLRGTLLRYDDPTEPVGVEDWDAIK